jgi:YidC/Oxa1 family membrane protein insertase
VLTPFYWAISWVMLRWHDLWSAIGLTGNFLRTNWDWVLAIIFLVITVRAILFPVYVKQIKSQRAMQRLAPQIKALQEKHKGDRETLQKETMELYRKEGTNPLMGCLPMVIQIPVMWALFHVLRHLNPNRHEATKKLYGWTVDQFDHAAAAKLFGAPLSASFRSTSAQLAEMHHANGTTVKIVAGILVVIMIATTYMTSRQMILKTGWAEDPTQKMIQRLMLYGIPVTLLFSGFAFPLGVVLYWTTTNIFSLGQQFWVLRKYPPPPMAKPASGQGAAGEGSLLSRLLGTGAAGQSSAGRPSTGASRVPTTSRAPAKPAKAAGVKAAGVKATGKPPAKTGARTAAKRAADSNGATAVDGKTLAPRPGAKPVVSPKKGPTKQAGTPKQNGTAAGTAKQGSGNAAKRTSG